MTSHKRKRPPSLEYKRDPLRWAAVGYLALQGLGGLVWWVMLIGWPSTRSWFRAADSSDATLLAFAAADLLLFVGGSLAAAWGLATHRRWYWAALCVHGGAAMYAALYCLLLGYLAPETWRGALLMSPSLVFPAAIVWRFRPRSDAPC